METSLATYIFRYMQVFSYALINTKVSISTTQWQDTATDCSTWRRTITIQGLIFYEDSHTVAPYTSQDKIILSHVTTIQASKENVTHDSHRRAALRYPMNGNLTEVSGNVVTIFCAIKAAFPPTNHCKNEVITYQYITVTQYVCRSCKVKSKIDSTFRATTQSQINIHLFESQHHSKIL